MNIDSMLDLRDADLRREGLFVAEGRLMVERSIAAGCRILGIAASVAAEKDARSLAADTDIGVTVLDGSALDRLAGFAFHRGMLAVAERPAPKSWREESAAGLTVRPAGPDGPPLRILVLPGITDPGNLGTLLRSALAFGFGTVLLGDASCDPYNRKALRASMGAAFRLRLARADETALKELAGMNVAVLAAAMEEGALRAGRDRIGTEAAALVLGNEYDGIPAAWRAACTAAIRIEVSPEVDSLNVAIAGSILMRELSDLRLP